MKTEFRTTEDGSLTLFVAELNEHYHSTFGALTESKHVFIEAGLKPAMLKFDEIHLLEIGFGTGLNTLLTMLNANQKIINYTAIEAFPVAIEIVGVLNYTDDPSTKELFLKMHNCSWNEKHEIIPGFFLTKVEAKIEELTLTHGQFNLVYFDAFGPDVQPELWTDDIFKKISIPMIAGGILTTYSAKGEIRRKLQRTGFDVERIPGPPGKRHMTRAFRKAERA
jgi:tRNA U34 5-methylaminomethyl-2-thiouridine-forming methyltransferase MnmC